jgi:hypothetical protein
MVTFGQFLFHIISLISFWFYVGFQFFLFYVEIQNLNYIISFVNTDISITHTIQLHFTVDDGVFHQINNIYLRQNCIWVVLHPLLSIMV